MASPARTAASGGVGEPPASSEKTPDEAMPSSPGPVHDQDVAAGCRTISNAVTASPDIDSQAKAIKSKDSENEPVHPGPVSIIMSLLPPFLRGLRSETVSYFEMVLFPRSTSLLVFIVIENLPTPVST